MDSSCLCGHATREHELDDGIFGICEVWIEEEDRWCPCIKFQGRTGTNSVTIKMMVTA